MFITVISIDFGSSRGPRARRNNLVLFSDCFARGREKGESTISFLTKLQKDTDYIADCTVVAVSLAYVLLPFDFVQFFILGANPAIDIVELC